MRSASKYIVVLITVLSLGVSTSLFAAFANEGDLYDYNVIITGEVAYYTPGPYLSPNINKNVDVIGAQVVLSGTDIGAHLIIPAAADDVLDIVIEPDFATGNNLSVNISWLDKSTGFPLLLDWWRMDAVTITLTDLDWLDGGTPGVINGITLLGTSGVAQGLTTTFTDDEIIISFYTSTVSGPGNTYETLDYSLDIGESGPTPIPEPSTYLLLGSTLLIVGAAKRRNKKLMV